MSRHIGVLMTATDTPPFAAEFPDDGEAFRNLLSPERPDWRFSIVYVKDNEFPERVRDYDGYVITGSPATVTDDRPWIRRLLGLIREIDAERIPLAGVCFGHQAIALALGGEVERAKQGWGFGVSRDPLCAQRPVDDPGQGGRATLHRPSRPGDGVAGWR